MPSFELLLIAALAVVSALGGLGLFWALRNRPEHAALEALARGDFAATLDLAPPDHELPEVRLARAVAAKHLLRWDEAEEALAQLEREDPLDAEVLLERGLVAAYRGDTAAADRHLRGAAALRADLLESLTLHRALVALLAGDNERARLLFEEIEAPLETKLRLDLGEGEPLFAEWFLHAAALWHARGQTSKCSWAWRSAQRTAPESRLPEHLSERLGVGG